MRNLKRNQSKIHYSLAVKDGGTDTNGNSIVTYSEPQPLNISVSAGKGEASMQPYGRDVDYDKEMVTTDKQCLIDEIQGSGWAFRLLNPITTLLRLNCPR